MPDTADPAGPAPAAPRPPWTPLDDDAARDLDDALDDGDGYRLRLSRDCTADDLAAFLPDMTHDDRTAWLARVRATGATVTFEVSTTVRDHEPH